MIPAYLRRLLFRYCEYITGFSANRKLLNHESTGILISSRYYVRAWRQLVNWNVHMHYDTAPFIPSAHQLEQTQF